MTLVLACASEPPGTDTAPPGEAYTGAVAITSATLACAALDHRWTVTATGAAGTLVLGLSDEGVAEETHWVQPSGADPAGWWTTFDLTLRWTASDVVPGESTAVSCNRFPEARARLELVDLDGTVLDCASSDGETLGEC